jgi:peptidoglycan biosynthesis protein MviN/MurJ (putative lipid II flippase)
MASLGEGMVAIYGYASRLHGALAQVLVIGLSTVLLPHFAALWSRGEKAEITILFRRLARCTILLVAYLTLGICLMGETATKILFQRGAFDTQQTLEVSRLWMLLSFSLFPLAFGTFIAKFCQAVREAGSVLASGIVSFAATWFVSWLGASLASTSIVASSALASVALVTCFWLFWLGKRIRTAPIFEDLGVAGFRILLILVPAACVERFTALYTEGFSDIIRLFARGSMYTLIVLLLLIATRSHVWFLARRPGEAA